MQLIIPIDDQSSKVTQELKLSYIHVLYISACIIVMGNYNLCTWILYEILPSVQMVTSGAESDKSGYNEM